MYLALFETIITPSGLNWIDYGAEQDYPLSEFYNLSMLDSLQPALNAFNVCSAPLLTHGIVAFIWNCVV